MSADSAALAFISLLRDPTEARGLANMLESLARSDASVTSLFLVPEVRGLDFFESASDQAGVDRWWGRHVPADATPVYLLRHEHGLARWLAGLDGRFMVAVDAAAASDYAASAVVTTDSAEAPLALAHAVVGHYGRSADRHGAPGCDLFDSGDAEMIARIRGHSIAPPATAPANTRPTSGDDALARPRSRPRLPSLIGVDDGAPAAPAPPLAPDALELLAADSAARERVAPAWDAAPSGTQARPSRRAQHPRGHHLPFATTGLRSHRLTATEVAGVMLARAPTIVVVGSRKGGVGKTSHAAGMAIAAGAILDTVGHTAALVDANVANPDAWGQLNLAEGAATVRDVVTALVSGGVPPLPMHASTPALACYPEGRGGSEYTRTEIRRLARHLRARHAFIVVDMSNRLPDPMSGPEATVAAFWLEEADALVLPTAMSRQDFNGVLDYLEVGGLPPTLVPCIVSPARRNRRHPVTRQYLDAIAARVERVLEVPDAADSVRLAGMEGVPVQDVSPRMRVAYREMAEAVAGLPARNRG